MRQTRRASLCLLLLLPLAQPMHGAQVLHSDHASNAASQQAKPYVVLVSLGGFRFDYPRKFGAVHLLELAARGATAPEGMVPAYPSLTFPDQYTLVTGLYPEHHGIVADSFYDPARKQYFSASDPASRADGSWYGGQPLWVLAEKQGMRTACYLWPGSDAEIGGERPSYYLRYDERAQGEEPIKQVAAWLRLPPELRPHFIALAYPDAEIAARLYGPESPQTAAAVKRVDAFVGELREDLDRLQLPIDLIVVSDHGMEQAAGDWIDLDRYAALSGIRTVGSLLYPDSDDAAERIYQSLKIKSDQFTVFRRARLPAGLHFDRNPRAGDPVVIATGPYPIRAHAPASGAGDTAEPGTDGYDARAMKSMRGIFVAAGPDIRPGTTLEPFESVNVFPLLARLLALDGAAGSDGSLNVLAGILAAGRQ